MDEESTATVPPLRYLNDSTAAITSLEHADLSIMDKRVTLHELEEMSLNMRSNNTVGFDHRTCVGINIIPWPADLGL
jgi:hypothetical protein